MPIFPVSLMTSGMSFVSSILEEINSSNWTEAAWIEGFNRQSLHLLTKEIFTDCDRACDNDNFVLWWLQTHSEQMKWQLLHVTWPFPKCDYIIVYPSTNTFRREVDRHIGKRLTDCSSRSSNWDLPFQHPQVLIYVRTKQNNSLKNWPSFSTSNRLLPKKNLD